MGLVEVYFELGKIRGEGDLSEIRAGKVLDGRSRGFAHVIRPDLLKGLLLVLGGGFELEPGAEDVAELGTVAVTTSSHFFLLVVVVG